MGPVSIGMAQAIEAIGGDGFLISTPFQRISRRFINEVCEGLIPALQRWGWRARPTRRRRYARTPQSSEIKAAGALHVVVNVRTISITPCPDLFRASTSRRPAMGTRRRPMGQPRPRSRRVARCNGVRPICVHFKQPVEFGRHAGQHTGNSPPHHRLATLAERQGSGHWSALSTAWRCAIPATSRGSCG